MANSEVRRIFNAFVYSLHGLKATWTTEPAFVIEVVTCILLIPLACVLSLPLISKALLISSLLLLLIVELINTAIEVIVDRISLDIHPLSKKAKDIGSAAMLISLINALIIWTLVIWPLIKSKVTTF